MVSAAGVGVLLVRAVTRRRVRAGIRGAERLRSGRGWRWRAAASISWWWSRASWPMRSGLLYMISLVSLAGMSYCSQHAGRRRGGQSPGGQDSCHSADTFWADTFWADTFWAD